MKSLIEHVRDEYEKVRIEAARGYADFLEFALEWVTKNRPVGVSHNAARNLLLLYNRGEQLLVSPELPTTQDPRQQDPRLRSMQAVGFSGPAQTSGPLPNPPTQNF